MKRLLLPAALLLLSTATAAPAADKASKPSGDLAKLQGRWSGKGGPNQDMRVALTIEGNTVTARVTTPAGEDIDLKGEFSVDEKATPHKAIDWFKFTGPNGDAMPDNASIYAFEDADTWKVRTSGPDKVRPTDFGDGPGDGRSGPSTILFKREKDPAK